VARLHGILDVRDDAFDQYDGAFFNNLFDHGFLVAIMVPRHERNNRDDNKCHQSDYFDFERVENHAVSSIA
jgi:hypothetical protein